MSYRPNLPITDPRIFGVERIDLRAKYSAPLDATLHPLSTMGLASAQAKYPNIGLTGSTNLATYAQDTAAWLQCEYDLRTGSGGVIGVCDGGGMAVSGQLYLQNADKVWFHGGRQSTLYTAGCGATPAIRISGAYTLSPKLILQDVILLANSGYIAPSSTAGGTAHTLYAGGAVALQIDNCINAEIVRVGWNGFDIPITWGDNVYGVTFRKGSFTGNNQGVSWRQTGGLNSMERIYFIESLIANNNYGGYWDATTGALSQGGSVFFIENAFDYNIVRALAYKGQPDGQYNTGHSIHFTHNHFETTGACSGTTLSRILSIGKSFFTNNEFYENDGGLPPGLIEVEDYTATSLFSNSTNQETINLTYSSTSGPKSVTGSGNRGPNAFVRVKLLNDLNGVVMQPLSASECQVLFVSADVGLPLSYQGFQIYCGATTLTVAADSSVNHAIGTSFQILATASAGVTVGSASGTTVVSFPNTLPNTVDQGKIGTLTKVGANLWGLFH